MSRNNESANENQYFDSLAPLLSRSQKFYENKTKKTMIVHFAVIALLAVAFTVAATFITIPNPALIPFGLIFGLGLFLAGYSFIIKLDDEKHVEDEDYYSLHERLSPAQRARYGFILFVIMTVLTVALFQNIPSIAGGTVVIASALGIYAFSKRTEEEFNLFIEGEIDERDIKEIDEDEASDELDRREAEEYVELVNSLPEETRKILLNPRLNGKITLLDEDDNKENKRKLFGKGK